MSEIIFKNGSYIYILPVSRGQTKRTIKIVKENQPIKPYSDECYNALLNVFKINGIGELKDEDNSDNS